MRYEDLMKLGKTEVERLSKLYDEQVISVGCTRNWQTGEVHYTEPVPDGAVPVNSFSNAVHFLRMTPEFEKLTENQLKQLGSYTNDKYRPSFLAYRD